MLLSLLFSFITLIGVASGVNRGKGYYCHPDEIHRWLKASAFDFLAAEEKTTPRK
jgi:hypothetical protein